MNTKLRLPLVLVGTLLFHFLFWKEDMGLNVILHFLFSTVVYALLYRDSFQNRSFQIALSGTFVLASAVVIHQSAMSQVVYWISAILTLGFAHATGIRTVLYASLRAGRDFIYVPYELIMLFRPKGDMGPKMNKLIWIIKIAIIPGILTMIFLAIYSNSNEVFGNYVDGFFNKVEEIIEMFIQKFGLAQFLFFIFGALMSGWFIQSTIRSHYQEKESKRKRYLEPHPIMEKIPSDSENRDRRLGKYINENASGSLLMIMINLMLVVLNMIDITHYWFDFDSAGVNLTQFVHEGTYLLILSILLSMALMLYYFRGYQNFSPNHKRLSLLAYVWIIQNSILVISVGIRNLHYIQHHALAYKRIGVFFFLLAVLFGLFTLYKKIAEKRTGFYLLNLNSWSIYIVFVIVGAINWDGFITRYNISKVPTIALDEDFLLNMSDKTLPLLLEHKHLFEEEKINRLYYRIHNFLREKSDVSWLSWNFAEDKAVGYFQKNPIPQVIDYEGRSYDPDLYLHE
jgi:hypothetical protein